jgi:hypothetical protein
MAKITGGTAFGSRIVAEVHIRGLSPYSQSRYHEEPAFENEDKGDYDKRTWRSHLHVENGTVHIPLRAIHECLTDAAQYSAKKISGNRTWTKPFKAGIAIFENPDLDIKPHDVPYIDNYCHVNGKPGSGSRVMRRFPQIFPWETKFAVHILDPIITETVFTDIFAIGGMFVGIGRYRPANRGSNGRFEIVGVDWHADRKLV